VIAIACWPIYHRFAGFFFAGEYPSLAPSLFTLLTGLVLVAPVILVLQQIVQESAALVHALERLRESGIPVPRWMARATTDRG
jgi:predicted PurR-regulated permease PerM